MVRDCRAGLVDQRRPRAIDLDLLAFFRLDGECTQVDAALIGHLQEQQVGQLLDVIAVVDAIVAECVAETPKFLNDV